VTQIWVTKSPSPRVRLTLAVFVSAAGPRDVPTGVHFPVLPGLEASDRRTNGSVQLPSQLSRATLALENPTLVAVDHLRTQGRFRYACV